MRPLKAQLPAETSSVPASTAVGAEPVSERKCSVRKRVFTRKRTRHSAQMPAKNPSLRWPHGQVFRFGTSAYDRKTAFALFPLLPMDAAVPVSTDSTAANLGRRVRAARVTQDLTLDAAGRLCSVSRSTLSKIENGLMSPTFDVLQKIVAGLKIDPGELFGAAPRPHAGGRRALTRKDDGEQHVYRGYRVELLATDLARKTMLPFRLRITAHAPDAFGHDARDEGEEFLYVLSGSVCLYSELYAPTHLQAGDSIYFDSRAGHAAVSTSKEDAEVLWIATGCASWRAHCGQSNTDPGPAAPPPRKRPRSRR